MSGLVPFNKNNSSLFDSDMNDFHNMLDGFFGENWFPSRNLTRDTFKIDVEEAHNAYLIHAELPGIQKDEINLDVEKGKLTISVKKDENLDEQKKSYIHRERRTVSMSRSIYLADSKVDDIKAKLEHGVLTIEVPKREKVDNTVKIDIE